MRRPPQLWILPVLFVLSFPAAAQTRFIVRPTPTGSIAAIDTRHSLQLVGPLDSQNRGIFVVTAPSTISPSQVIADVSADVDCTDIERDVRMAVSESPSNLNQASVAILDSMPMPSAIGYYGTPVLGLYLSQPATSLIRLSDAQTTFGMTGAGVVAIVDTGVDVNHAALQGHLVPGYDFVHNQPSGSEMIDLTLTNLTTLTTSNPNPTSKTTQLRLTQASVAILDQASVAILDTQSMPPAFGHGTMVAGLVHLIAPSAKIMPLKAFRGDGTALLSDILRAIYYAADNGARVINMSFTLLAPSVEMQKAITYANDAGAIMVASTGNTGKAVVGNPAAMQKVMGVASTSDADVRSSFSSYGSGTFVAAPGEQVITLYPGNNYAVASGTSFTSPMVAGTAALTVQAMPATEFSNTSRAISQAQPVPNVGNGRLDVYQAVQFAIQNATSTTGGLSQ
jgi:hypothetical protein